MSIDLRDAYVTALTANSIVAFQAGDAWGFHITSRRGNTVGSYVTDADNQEAAEARGHKLIADCRKLFGIGGEV